MAVTQTGKHIIKVTAAADALGRSAFVKKIRVVGMTLGDEAIFDDGDGDIIAHFIADANNFTDEKVLYETFSDVVADTLDSGTAYIHVG